VRGAMTRRQPRGVGGEDVRLPRRARATIGRLLTDEASEAPLPSVFARSEAARTQRYKRAPLRLFKARRPPPEGRFRGKALLARKKRDDLSRQLQDMPVVVR